jgi:pimeloyl-ACP methyl ester carboxylesterase
MLLLHGLANSSTVWDEFLRHRPEWLECWTADLPWRADGPLDWAHRTDLSPWLADALQSVPGGAGVVVAHSFSANLLLRFLSTELASGANPFRRYGIDGLVLVSPFYRRSPEEFDWGMLTNPHAAFVRIMAEGVRLQTRRCLGAAREIELAERVCERVGPYGWIRFFESYLRTPWLRLPEMRLPVLVAIGARDAAAAEGAALAADLPSGVLDVSGASGHFPMCAQPDRFARVVTRFCTQLAERPVPTTVGVG